MPNTKKKSQVDSDKAQPNLTEQTSTSRSGQLPVQPEEPPAWLSQLLAAQQAQMEMFMTQLINHPSQGRPNQLTDIQNRPEPEIEVISHPRKLKADAPKPPILNVGISLAEFTKWRKAHNDYVTVSQAQELPLQSRIALLRTFFSMELREAVEHILLIPDDTNLEPDAILDKIKQYIRCQRNVALDCVAFEERKQETGESFDSFLIGIKSLARDADLCNDCLDRRLVTKIMSGIGDKETRTKLLAISPLPNLKTITDICRAEESARLDEARIDVKKAVYANRFHNPRPWRKERPKSSKNPCTRCGNTSCPPKGQNVCPAKDKVCTICHKKGHFGSVCFTKINAYEQTPKPYKKRNGHVRKVCLNKTGIPDTCAAPIISVKLRICETQDLIGTIQATPDTGA